MSLKVWTPASGGWCNDDICHFPSSGSPLLGLAISKPVTHLLFHLCEITRIENFLKTKGKLVVARCWWEEQLRTNYLVGMEFPLGDDEDILQQNNNGGCTTL